MAKSRALRAYRRVAAVVGFLLALTIPSLRAIEPPDPRGVDTPANVFSASRAFGHVERIASAPHAVGSSANASVHDYLVSTLTGLGLRVETQDTIGKSPVHEAISAVMAHVRNIVALLPGTNSTGRVILIAHYDSVPNGPGASDDGAGVAAILEVARALSVDGNRLRNDILFVLSDAEEACLCGAEAFAGQHLLASQGGVVVNLEARGARGPVITFETSPGNFNLISVFGAHAPWPVGASFAVEVYRLLPNDTDFSAFLHSKKNGGPEFTGLNAAFIDQSAVYHTSKDTSANLDQGSLQAHGHNALALARAFATVDLTTFKRPARADATYFPFVAWLMRYPSTLVWPLALSASIAVLGIALYAYQLRQATLRDLVTSFGLTLVPIVLSTGLAQGFWKLLVAIRPGYDNMIDPWRPFWFRFAVIALVIVVVTGWYALLRSRFAIMALSIGALAWLALFGLVLAAVTPGGSYLTTIPALAGAVAGATAFGKRLTWISLLALAIGAAISMLILAPTVMLVFAALGLARGGVPALVATLLALALLPILECIYPEHIESRFTKWTRWWIAIPTLSAGVLTLLGAVVGLWVDQFDKNHPQPAQLMYVVDADRNTAHWVSGDRAVSHWTAQFVHGSPHISDAYPVIGFPVRTGDAQLANLAAPELTVLSDSVADHKRSLSFRLTSKRSVRFAFFQVRGKTKVLSATIAGRTLTPTDIGDAKEFSVLFYAPPADGLNVVLILDAASIGPLTIRSMDGSDGLAGVPGYSAPPIDTDVRATHFSNLVLVEKTYRSQ